MWGYVNFSEGCRVLCGFPKTNTSPQTIKIVPNPKQDTFSDCFDLSFLRFMKTTKFPDL